MILICTPKNMPTNMSTNTHLSRQRRAFKLLEVPKSMKVMKVLKVMVVNRVMSVYIGCTALEGFERLGQRSDTKLPVLYENLAIIELRNTSFPLYMIKKFELENRNVFIY